MGCEAPIASEHYLYITTQVFGDEKLTTALLDRLGHRSHILTTKGSSYRTKQHPKEGGGKTAAE